MMRQDRVSREAVGPVVLDAAASRVLAAWCLWQEGGLAVADDAMIAVDQAFSDYAALWSAAMASGVDPPPVAPEIREIARQWRGIVGSVDRAILNLSADLRNLSEG